MYYYSTGSSAKFRQKWLGENSPFLLHFLMHIHVLMLFELIAIIITWLVAGKRLILLKLL